MNPFSYKEKIFFGFCSPDDEFIFEFIFEISLHHLILSA